MQSLDRLAYFPEWQIGKILVAEFPTSAGMRTEFYQIVERTPKMVRARQLRANQNETAAGIEITPRPNDFRYTEPPFDYAPRRRILPTGEAQLNDVALARLWDGQPSIYTAL